MLIGLTKNSPSIFIYYSEQQQLELHTTHHFEFPLWGSTYFGSHCTHNSSVKIVSQHVLITKQFYYHHKFFFYLTNDSYSR